MTADQMARIDRNTVESGIPALDLMRNAGSAVFDFVVGMSGIHRDFFFPVVAGKGNNGGDGFRAAQLLAEHGYRTAILLAGRRADVSGIAAECLREAEAVPVPLDEIAAETDLPRLREYLDQADVIVDALFGTGLTGDIRGIASGIADAVNASVKTVVSVDIPSGVDASTGQAGSHAVRATYTVTFGCVKVGHVLRPGRDYSGDVNLADIGFPADIIEAEPPFAQALAEDEAAALLPVRRYDAHKGFVGRVLVMAGSVGKTGAAALCSNSVLRAGAGVAVLCCPASLNDILEVKCTEVMTRPLPELRKKRVLALRALGELSEAARGMDVAAVGPGLGTYRETVELVRRFVGSFEGTVVLDADGINAFAGRPNLLRDAPGRLVLTPHPGELARLMDMTVGDIAADPFEAARLASAATGAVVLLKGVPTVIAVPEGGLWINGTGNEGMATAGTGDVLTGIVAGLAAQGCPPENAAILGAYLHGLAGDLAAREKGMYSMIAGDLLDSLPAAIGQTNEARVVPDHGEEEG